MKPNDLNVWLQSPKLFKEWLEVQPESYVGYKRGCSSCPIAEFLKAKLNKKFSDRVEIQVAVGYVSAIDLKNRFRQGSCTSITPPKWVQNFILTIDNAGETLHENNYVVKKTEALQVLEKVING